MVDETDGLWERRVSRSGPSETAREVSSYARPAEVYVCMVTRIREVLSDRAKYASSEVHYRRGDGVEYAIERSIEFPVRGLNGCARFSRLVAVVGCGTIPTS